MSFSEENRDDMTVLAAGIWKRGTGGIGMSWIGSKVE